MKISTLLKIGDDPSEKDLNNLESEDHILSGLDRKECDEQKISKSSNGHIVEKRIKELCSEIEKLTASTNWEPVKSKIDLAKEEIEKIDSDNKFESLHKKFDEYYDKIIRRYNNHVMIKKDIDFKEELCNEIENLLEDNDLQATERKFKEIKDNWQKCKELPERYEEILEKKYRNLCKSFTNKQADIKNKLESKLSVEKIAENCCNELEAMINENNIKRAVVKFAEIEKRWTDIISNSTDIDLLKKRFESAAASFKTKKDEFIKEQEDKKKSVHEEALAIIDQLEKCLSEKKMKNVLHRVKELQDEWDKLEKDVVKRDLIKTFFKLSKKYFSKLKFLQQKEDWARWENYTNKVLLCEQVEKLLTESDNFKVAKEIKIIWEKWRKIGQAPREKNDEIWERFNGTRQKIKAKCNDFFSNLKVERGDNTERKKELCAKAEDLSTSSDWETTADELKHVQSEWKSIGPASKDIDEELYERFRNACNMFFENRIEFYKKLHHKQAVNKNIKRDLIDEAESLKDLYWKDAIKKIKDIRNQWRKAGSASRHDEQKLWSRFNNVIEGYLAELDNSKPGNLSKKEKVCEKISILIESLTGNAKNAVEVNSQIEVLKEEWKNVGPVPREKEDEIYDKYDELIRKLSNSHQKILEEKAVELTHNKKIKENILFEIENLSEKGFIDNKEKYEEICDKWKSLSVVCLDTNEEMLNSRFADICNAFENKNSDFFIVLRKKKEQNLKEKIKICVELEKLTDITTSKDALGNDSLADELMFAIKGNFAVDKRQSSREDSYSKFKKLQKKWLSVGPVPIEEFENINLRYNKICSNIEAKVK